MVTQERDMWKNGERIIYSISEECCNCNWKEMEVPFN